MKSVSLTAYPRTLGRRSGAKKTRANGRVPAVIYGRHGAPQSLEVTLKDIETLIHHSVSENVLVDLSVSGDAKAKRLALIQEVQHHPLSGGLLHIDFHEVVENEKVLITVPVETVGEAAGVKTGGGVLEHVLFKLKVRALPKDLPEIIQVDVSNLQLGQAVHIGDIPAPAGVEILGDKKIVVLSVAAPRETKEAEAAPGAAGAAEPEMIKEKKDAAAPAAGGDKAGGDKGADKKAADKKK